MFDILAKVEKNRLFGHYGHLTVSVEDNRLAVAPGQFAMLRPRESVDPLLRRAMAVYRTTRGDGETKLEFIYQIFGRGTAALGRLLPGQFIDCLAPLGKPFDIAPVAVGGREALLVAGGVGATSLHLLAETLVRENVSVRLFLGGRASGDLIGLDDYLALGCKVHVATNDGSRGFAGFVTGPLERFLVDHDDEVREGKFVLYTCGPPVMLRRVAEIAAESNILAYASLEERMACGFGVCVGCVAEIKTSDRTDSEPETDYLRVCVEGPVFRCDQVVWT